MTTLAAGASANITLAAGTEVRGTGAGSAVIGRAATVKTLTAGDAWRIGPFLTAQAVSITAASAISYEVVAQVTTSPSPADTGFTAVQVAAAQSLVSADGNLAYAAVASTTGTPGEVRKLSDGPDKGAVLTWAIPEGRAVYAWCWQIYPLAAYL